MLQNCGRENLSLCTRHSLHVSPLDSEQNKKESGQRAHSHEPTSGSTRASLGSSFHHVARFCRGLHQFKALLRRKMICSKTAWWVARGRERDRNGTCEHESQNERDCMSLPLQVKRKSKSDKENDEAQTSIGAVRSISLDTVQERHSIRRKAWCANEIALVCVPALCSTRGTACAHPRLRRGAWAQSCPTNNTQYEPNRVGHCFPCLTCIRS